MSQPFVYSYYAPSDPKGAVPVFGDLTGDMKADVLLPDTTGALRVIGGGSDPAAAPKAGISSAPGGNGWNGIQISHRGSLGYKTVDDLFAHAPSGRDLSLYRNDGILGRFDSRAAATVLKPTGCRTSALAPVPCAEFGFGPDWSNVTHIAAFGNHTGDSSAKPNSVPRTSLLFVEKGRLWLATAGDTDQLSADAVLLSANDTRWDGYELVTPGRAQGTDFPTLWARSKADGSMRALTVKGTSQAPDLTGFADPDAGTLIGKVDPTAYPRVGSDGDLTGDGIPDLWAVEANRQLVAFNGVGTRPNGRSVPHPTVTAFDPAPVVLGNLNMPQAQWPLTGQKDDGTTHSSVGNLPATATGVTWPTATIGGRGTTYAAFDGASSSISTPTAVIDTRKSFTISTTAMATKTGGVVLSQGTKGNASLLLFPNHDGTIRTNGACLNATAAGTANTTPVELRTCDGGAPSQKFLPRADGSIHNPVSGRCLDLGNTDTTPGRQLWLWDCNGSDAQRWSVPLLGTAPLPVPAP